MEFVLLQNKKETSFTLDIYLDDTIDNIKYKLSKQLPVKNIHYYYLFYKKEKIVNPYDVYKKLSQNNKVLIDHQTFVSFCMNHNLPYSKQKEYYEIDDFLESPLDKPVLVNEPIGVENKLFIINPFDNIFNFYENAQSSSSTLIMNYLNVRKIYVCLAPDVYQHIHDTGLEI
jgi:hypothetical protein